MVNKGVASWLLKDHLDKTALGAGQVEGLAAATFRIATFKGVGALLKNSVELGSDDVEGTPPAWTSREHPDAHSLTDPGFEGLKDVLVGVTVEHRQIRGLVGNLGSINFRPIVLTEVSLRLHQVKLPISPRQVVGRHDDGTEHACCNMGRHWGGGAMVEPDPGAMQGEVVVQLLPRSDGAHDPGGGDSTGVKVQRVTHSAPVDQMDPHLVADARVDNRSHVTAVVGHRVDGGFGGDLLYRLLGDERHPVNTSGHQWW